jgi:hypothetical protein
MLRKLITYVILSTLERGGTLAKTKLVKLLYLIDVECYRRARASLTGLTWRFYHYGPYSVGVDNALRQLDLDIPQEQVSTRGGFTAITFRPPPYLEVEPDQFLSAVQRRVVDRVLDRWALEDLNSILDHVYFQTEPMKEARRGQILDLSLVRPLSDLGAVRPKASTELKERFKTYLTHVETGKGRVSTGAVWPEPRFDSVYVQALQGMAERVPTLPAGELELDESAKGNIREQGDR